MSGTRGSMALPTGIANPVVMLNVIVAAIIL
jgi:hypothetical protein